MDREVNCDKCGADFRIKLRKKTKSGGIEITYFTCPKCFNKYTVSVFDAKCRKLQREIREFDKRIQDVAQQYIQREINDDEYVLAIDTLKAERLEKKAILESKSNQLKNETV